MSFGYFAQGLVGGLEAGQRFSRNAQLMRDYEEERQREIENRKAIEGFVGDPLFGAQPGTMPAPSPVAPVPQVRGLGAPSIAPAGRTAPVGGPIAQRYQTLAPVIEDAASRHGVPPQVLAGLLAQESGFNHGAVGDNDNSWGMGQFNRKGAAADFGLTREQILSMSPQQQIDMTAKFLAQKVAQEKGDVWRGVRRYNGGGDPNYVQNVQSQMAGLGLSDTPRRVDPRMADVSGQPSPAVSPYGLPDRGVPSYQAPTLSPQQRAERAAQMAQTVQPYAQKYMEGLKLAARDPKAAAQLAPLLQQVKTQGMAQWLSQFDGDISTMAGAHQLVVHAANGMAMFGEMPDVGGLYDMAKDREMLGRDTYRTSLDERRLALSESQAATTEANNREVLLKRQLENDVYTRTHLMELIDTGQAGPAKDFAKTHLGIDIMEMAPDVLEVPELGVTLPTVSVTYRDANGETQTVKAAEVLYKTTLYEAAIRQRLKGSGAGGEAAYKFTAGEREALNAEIETRVDDACANEYGGECNAEQRLGLRREIEPAVIAEAQRFMDETARPAGDAQADDIFSDDVMLHLDSVFGDEE